MPIIHGLLYSAVRLMSVDDLLGTGFIITVKSESIPDRRYGYIVTAEHVIKNHIEINMQAADPTRDGTLHEAVAVDKWHAPLAGVDIAIAPLPPDVRAYAAMALEKHTLPNADMDTPNLGAPVYYVGVFAPLDRVVARSGTIAAVNQGGVPHSEGYRYPAHLMDCRSYKGFSGSPCFCEFAFATDREAEWPYQITPEPGELRKLAYVQLLCGMFTRHYDDDTAAGGVVSRYGIGVLVRSDEIQAALMTKQLIAQRKDWDRHGYWI